jgi:hypothetical protein
MEKRVWSARNAPFTRICCVDVGSDGKNFEKDYLRKKESD